MSSKKRRTYSEDFKKQMVSLYESGKSPAELIDEYDWSPHRYISGEKKYGSNSNDDVTVDNKESIDESRKLREENQKLRMEVDILKQATLIMGRKSK
ncbi:Transposase [Erysipelothrix urinaevulpis]